MDSMKMDIDEEVEMELALDSAEMMEIDEDVEMEIVEYDEEIELAMEMGFDMSGESDSMEIEFNLGELTFSLVNLLDH